MRTNPDRQVPPAPQAASQARIAADFRSWNSAGLMASPMSRASIERSISSFKEDRRRDSF